MIKLSGVVQNYDVHTGLGTIKSENKVYTFTNKDIGSITTGPSSFRMVKVGQQVSFEVESGQIRNIRPHSMA